MAASSMDAGRRVDPILFEVIRNALVEVTEEMSVSLQRTAFSTNVKTRLDYSCAFVDAAGRMVAQAFCQPAHLVTIGRLVPRAVAEYGEENLAPGDMLVVNDPHRQASHLNDIFLIAPFHYRGELAGYLANICHHVDVGGGAPASIGAFRETYQEGIILPVVKLVARDEIDAGLWKMILANVRAKKEVAGDLRAQISANHLGASPGSRPSWTAMAGTRWTSTSSTSSITPRSGLVPRSRSCPTAPSRPKVGWTTDGMTDVPVRLQARVTLDGRKVAFDFAGTDAQRWAPMNCNLTQTFTACVYVLKCLIDPDVPVNEGFSQPIEGDRPRGLGGQRPPSRRDRRRLGGVPHALRGALQGPLPSGPGQGPGRNQGNDLSCRLRRRGPPHRRLLHVSRDPGRRLRRALPVRRSGRGPAPTSRTPRTRRWRRRSSTTPCASLATA